MKRFKDLTVWAVIVLLFGYTLVAFALLLPLTVYRSERAECMKEKSYSIEFRTAYTAPMWLIKQCLHYGIIL